MHIIAIAYECTVSGGSVHDPIPDPGLTELKFFNPDIIRDVDLIDGEMRVIELLEIN